MNPLGRYSLGCFAAFYYLIPYNIKPDISNWISKIPLDARYGNINLQLAIIRHGHY